MISRSVIFWDTDTQADFMLPGGKLYVPGAEKLIPNMKRLTDAARQGRVLIVGDADAHTPDDPEFKRFPPHCVRGTPGAEIIPETRAEKILVIPSRADAAVPEDLSEFQQIILEKQTLDVFDNPHAEMVLERIAGFTDADAEFFIFGVVTEYCVRLAKSAPVGVWFRASSTHGRRSWPGNMVGQYKSPCARRQRAAC